MNSGGDPQDSKDDPADLEHNPNNLEMIIVRGVKAGAEVRTHFQILTFYI